MGDEKETKVEEQETTLEGSIESNGRAEAYAAHEERVANDPNLAPVEEEDELQDTELVAEGKEEEEPEEEETTEEEQEDAEVDEPTEDEPVTIKVDGEEMQVSQAEVDEAGGVDILQKVKAADKRLREATLKLKRAELAETQRMAQAPTLPPTSEAPATPVPGVPQPPKFQAPDEIRKELMEIDRKIAVEGVATQDEFDELQKRKYQLMDDYYSAQSDAKMQYEQEQARQRQEAEATEHLVRTVSTKFPTYEQDMFLLDETGQKVGDPRYGFDERGLPRAAALNPDFEKYLADKPPAFAQMVLASTDPKDVEFVLNDFYNSKKTVQAPTLAEKRQKKKTIENVEASKGKAPASKKKRKDLSDDAEYARQMKKDRATGDYGKPLF
jgi:small-conductance mechanosensitive channel